MHKKSRPLNFEAGFTVFLPSKMTCSGRQRGGKKIPYTKGCRIWSDVAMMLIQITRESTCTFLASGSRDVALLEFGPGFAFVCWHLNDVLRGVEGLVQSAAPKFFK